MIRYLPFAAGSLLIATGAVAQPAPPPPAPGATPDQAIRRGPGPDVPPPPPRDAPGPRGERPAPPPRGAAIHIERGPDGAFRVDVHCAERDATKECADIATQILDKVGPGALAK